MVVAYKYMFDRRFDEPEEQAPNVQEDVSEHSFEGVPSISELLNTLQKEDVETVSQQASQNAEEELSDGLEESSLESSEAPEAVSSEVQELVEEEVLETQQEAFLREEKERLEKELLAKEIEAQALKAKLEQLQSELQTKELCLMPEEVETAKQTAFLEGKEKGIIEAKEATWQEAMASIDKQNTDLLERMDFSLREMLNRSDELSATAFENSLTLFKALSRKILPALSEKHAIEEIDQLLEKNFQFLKEEPKISLRIHPFLADKIKPVVARIVKKEAYVGKVAVLRDDSIALGDCRVEWKNGGVERKTEDVLAQAEALMMMYLQPTSQENKNKLGEEENE